MISKDKVVKIDGKDIENILFVGDIHGELGLIRYFAQRNPNSIMVYCGDIGMGFYKSGYYETQMDHIEQALEKYNCIVILIRGNHDDPSYFSGSVDRFHPEKYNNIHFADDWQVFSTKFGNILTCGGAVSVDKQSRTEDITWWSGEVVKMIDPKDIIKDIPKDMNIDIVASHTNPLNFEPFDNKANLMGWCSKEIIEECDVERKYMMSVYYELVDNYDVKYWFHGHFHFSSSYRLDNMRVRSLNINEIKSLDLDYKI